MNMVLPKTSQS